MGKKVLLLPSSIKGHFMQYVRFGEFLVKQSDLEIHIATHEHLIDKVPTGVHVHIMPPDKHMEKLETIFIGLAKDAKNWKSSMIGLVKHLDVEVAGEGIYRMMQMVKDLKVDVVVCEGAFNVGNYFYTFCKNQSVPFVITVPPGRPDPLLQLSKLLPIVISNLTVFKNLVKSLSKLKKFLSDKGVGKPIKSKPIELLIGSQALVKAKLDVQQIFIGSFQMMPRPQEQKSISEIFGESLASWILSTNDLGPIVYIAFGTLVVPWADLIHRLVEALDVGKWRILWSLPKSQQEHLPAELAQDRWRIEEFVPQVDLFQLEQMGCFISHCGSNSVHEAMFNGVPMVCMPFFCDQYEWATSVCDDLEAGVQVDKYKSSAIDLQNAVTKVLEKPLYREKAQDTARQMLGHAEALAKEFGTHVPEDSSVSASVAAEILRRLLNGDDPQTSFPAVKKATEKFKPRPIAGCACR